MDPSHQVTPACALDAEGMRLQGERYRRLAPAVESIRREGTRLTVRFGAGVDRAALDEAIAIERDCCPFFAIAFEPEARELTVSVEEPRLAGALDALAEPLGARG